MNINNFGLALTAVGVLSLGSANAAVQGITGPTFNLVASADYVSQPDGAMIYSWGYGCRAGTAVQKWSGAGPTASCPSMQMP